MGNVRKHYSLLAIVLASVAVIAAQTPFAALTIADSEVVSQFEKRAQAYADLREQIESKLPPLAKKATAEEIEAHKITFLKSVQAARGGAKHGDIFTPAATTLIRSIIADEFRGKDRADFRKRVLQAENKGVPIKVNVPYPESKELLETPPTLLLVLPKLPKQLNYRFVGDYLLLVDRENELIIDYMSGALPPANGRSTTAKSDTPPITPNTTPGVAPAPATVNPSVAVNLPSPLTLPLREGSVRFAVFGDAGRGSKEQYELGRVMETYHKAYPFDSVLLVGDNIYGPDSPADMKKKFEDAYRQLLDDGVKFYASLGNHDTPNQRFYAPFNMNGQDFYQIEKNGVSFYALNSNYLDKRQLDWLHAKLAADQNKWKIAFFHHPPFSSGGRHGSDENVRTILHPIFVKSGVDIVFTGHDHFYERIKPQDGITYFVTGAAGKIRKGDIKDRSPLSAAAFDTDLSFMMIEIAGDEMYFQVIARDGKTVDSGVIQRRD
jgi:predicted phosphodiesterase